jgi:hypothetical protein
VFLASIHQRPESDSDKARTDETTEWPLSSAPGTGWCNHRMCAVASMNALHKHKHPLRFSQEGYRGSVLWKYFFLSNSGVKKEIILDAQSL